jgi:hypothetical protein
MTRHPGIDRAVAEMAACNEVRIVDISGLVLPNNAREIGEWLTGLSDDELRTVVDGESEESAALCRRGPPGTNDFLEEMFATVCEGE